MTDKWTIRKYPIRGDGRPAIHPWFVFSPGVTPTVTHCNALNFGFDIFHTFPQALACVEYQTRKTSAVKVVLPKVEKSKCIDPGMSPAMFVDKTPGNYGIYLGHRLALAVTAKELKPLGEYLLALHYEKEQKQ